MRQIAPECSSVTELMEAGTVAAWQAGMVQFRAPAIAAAGRLHPRVSSLALGITQSISTNELVCLLRDVQEQVWLTIDAARNGRRRPGIAAVATAGAFTGFGGDFARPPLVGTDGRRLLATDGTCEWELLADAFGVWLRRIGSSAQRHSPPTGDRKAVVDRRGTIHWGAESLAQPHLAHAASFACIGQTLAVTIPTSHHIFLYGSAGSPP
jgi:hypothetical protein